MATVADREALIARGLDALVRNNGRFVGVREAAELLRLSEASVRRFLTQQKLKRFKVGSRTLLDRAQVLSLVKEV